MSLCSAVCVSIPRRRQGEEADVILLSTVRNAKDGRIGFLRLRNRVNVMLSRARHGMVVLGNQASLRAGAER
jgi:superfamily I DNA and/or RNA helicase